MSLVDNRIQASGEIFGDIVDWNDNRNFGIHKTAVTCLGLTNWLFWFCAKNKTIV